MVTTKTEKYIESVGRRKSSVARVRMTPSSKQGIKINGKSLDAYFPVKEYQNVASRPLSEVKSDQKFDITVLVNGGGTSSQAGAIRLGIARGLVIHKEDFRKPLKKAGHLKRDPRAKERRKFGLKKARKAPQWSKR